ncbi:MAG: AmpD protein [Cellvibrionaceae bacterium]
MSKLVPEPAPNSITPSGSPLTISKGRLLVARVVSSPNFNERPKGEDDIDLLVIHNVSLPPEQFGGDYIEHFFCNQLDENAHPYFKTIVDLQVSAHLLITREGEIIQFVPFGARAWHAGRSYFNGREECNDYSIGIELEGADTIAYTDTQYRVLADVTHAILHYYPRITKQRIVGHSEIAPTRKTDPGEAFNWTRYFELLES